MSGWGANRGSSKAPSSAQHRQGKQAPPKKVKHEEATPFPVPSERADRAAGYLEHCQVFLTTQTEQVRGFLLLTWALGAIDTRLELRRPDRMRPHEVVREGWWLIWTGTVPS